LKAEMKRRRKKYLEFHRLWLGDMDRYRIYVQEWREYIQDCNSRGVRAERPMPSPPPKPSHLPSEEELIDIIRHAQKTLNPPPAKKKQSQGNAPPPPAGRVGRMAAAAEVDSIRKERKCKENEEEEVTYCAADAEGGHELCAEVSHMLAPTAAHPVPVGKHDVHRPVCPTPV